MNDVALYFAAPEAEAEAILERLFRAELLPQLERIARRSGVPADRVALVVGDAALSLLIYLRSQRGKGEPPRHWEAFLRTTVENAHTNHLRHQFAPYVRFKHRVRFALENSPELACWNDEGKILASYADPDLRKCASYPLSDEQPEMQRFLQTISEAGNPEDSKALRRILIELLRQIPAPVAINELTALLARLYGLTLPSDVPSSTKDMSSPETLLEQSRYAVCTADLLMDQMENRAFLARLWSEIQQLRPQQRAVILLNLRDSQGHGVLELLPEVGVATLSEIRSAIEEATPLTDAQWERLREAMPLADAEVAEWLSTTRETVHGLRRAARERLQRRMRTVEKNLD